MTLRMPLSKSANKPHTKAEATTITTCLTVFTFSILFRKAGVFFRRRTFQVEANKVRTSSHLPPGGW
jgi:hypothetical protein